jgi:hypothetical protein
MDDVDCANETNTSISAINETKDTPNKEEHSENKCTPFCHCVCCSTSIIFQSFVTEKNIKIYPSATKFSTPNIKFSSNDITVIWQPPRFTV